MKMVLNDVQLAVADKADATPTAPARAGPSPPDWDHLRPAIKQSPYPTARGSVQPV